MYKLNLQIGRDLQFCTGWYFGWGLRVPPLWLGDNKDRGVDPGCLKSAQTGAFPPWSG